ncbi:putative signaling protein PA1727 [Propionispora sp. 2/2-37]|uniref:putative bifunctional diguanylate cyclase/phosphodiesterase n=1 Tax=Propionispora sp. 2/2-37 TaxID=1677858 RepID=UPI0006BB72AE|nr:bifunctional diguanylate cyclase/phosphodiesterase [Propionispora sp. 2/2-37]CUH96824.1 putative signaling protein PA1727 [Propionispora sp. 2/2-37]
MARIGGDEFVVILPGTSGRTEIAGIADNIVRELGISYDVWEESFSMSASIGIAVYPADGNTAEEILKNADNAMYAAKRKDKNGWCFYEAFMQSEALEKTVLRNSLRYAVERKELSLAYQPQAAAKGAAVVGFEALLRWDSPEHGPVSPGCFIPVAEQSGLIQPMGAWVLKEACAFARRLADHGYEDIYIAVNVSAKQIAADDFVGVVRGALAEAGIKPGQIELEITESFLMSSMEDAKRKFGELRATGIRLALDDFGTGFSSLTYLWNLPVTKLKIDKSFIDIIMHDTAKTNIVSTIIKMAHDFNMVVVAEGVETEQQYTYLTENSCDLIQGYYISRPVDETEAIRLLHKGKDT